MHTKYDNRKATRKREFLFSFLIINTNYSYALTHKNTFFFLQSHMWKSLHASAPQGRIKRKKSVLLSTYNTKHQWYLIYRIRFKRICISDKIWFCYIGFTVMNPNCVWISMYVYIYWMQYVFNINRRGYMSLFCFSLGDTFSCNYLLTRNFTHCDID